jgi:uncharacterized protein YjlB
MNHLERRKTPQNKGELSAAMRQPQQFIFKDDGSIPNSRYPVLLYRAAVELADEDPASSLEERFAENHWTDSWRNGIYTFHHYHSTSHEVLGIYRGSATVRLGGEQGQELLLEAGDIVVIPAGVGHKNLGSSPRFGVVGAYPDGRPCDLLRGRPGERPQADQNIAAIPMPNEDPIYGQEGPLKSLWGQT